MKNCIYRVTQNRVMSWQLTPDAQEEAVTLFEDEAATKFPEGSKEAFMYCLQQYIECYDILPDGDSSTTLGEQLLTTDFKPYDWKGGDNAEV